MNSAGGRDEDIVGDLVDSIGMMMRGSSPTVVVTGACLRLGGD